MAVADLIRKIGISEQTFYRWKKQYFFGPTAVSSASYGWCALYSQGARSHSIGVGRVRD